MDKGSFVEWSLLCVLCELCIGWVVFVSAHSSKQQVRTRTSVTWNQRQTLKINNENKKVFEDNSKKVSITIALFQIVRLFEILKVTYLIRVAVGRGSPVLQISTSFLGYISWDANGATAVGYSCWKIVNRGSLVEPRQSSFIVLALVGVVCFDVSNMMSRKLVNSSFDFRQSTFLSHLQGWKVCVRSSTIPISLVEDINIVILIWFIPSILPSWA